MLKLLFADGGRRLLFKHSFNQEAMEQQRDQLVKSVHKNDPRFAFRGALQCTRNTGREMAEALEVTCSAALRPLMHRTWFSMNTPITRRAAHVWE